MRKIVILDEFADPKKMAAFYGGRKALTNHKKSERRRAVRLKNRTKKYHKKK